MNVFERFTISFDSSNPVNWVILAILVVLPVIQIGLISRNSTLSILRKWIRTALNLLLWLVLLAYFFRVEWRIQNTATSVLIADNRVPDDYISHLKDSLKIREAVRVNAIKEPIFRMRLADGKVDSVLLVGASFSPDVLGQISRQAVRWIPYYQPDHLQQIRWKGLVRKGEMQTVSGSIQSSRKQVLKIRFGNQTVDSLPLPGGFANFNFQFPVFSQGRTEVELVLDQKPLDTLRFFARAPEPVAYQFILGSPDFESKTLADWLGKKKYSVQLTSLISKNISNRVTINRAATPDVIITDPDHASHPTVKKAVTQGKPVLFINASEPETDSKTINQALGTAWQVKKISNEAVVSIGSGIQALPYQFRDAVNQFPVVGYPVAVQKTTAKIGFSLVSETFPLLLSGDSVAYDRIWTAILTQLQPSFRDNIHIEAPVLTRSHSVVDFNNLASKLSTIQIGHDTVSLNYSSINGRSAHVSYLFGYSGWQPLLDSLAIYVQNPDEKPVLGGRLMSEYVRTHASEYAEDKSYVRHWIPVKIAEWVWFLLFLGCFAALWIEPKLVI